jgi:GH3 auxin-responsive promoter
MFRGLLYKAFSVLGEREAKAFELDAVDCGKAQSERLLQMLKMNAGTTFGKNHNFDSINNVSDFQKAIPIQTYDDLSSYINQVAAGATNVLTVETPFMFATTSGTTGARKLIPVTKSYIREFRRASTTSGFNLLRNFPGLAKGVALSIFSPAEEGRTEAGIPFGAISGRLYLDEPKLIRKYVSPIPYEVFLIKDYELRYYTLLRCALMLPVSLIYTLNPSTIMLLARRLQTHAEKLISDVAKGTLTLESELAPNILQAIQPFLTPAPKKADFFRALHKEGRFTPNHVWPGLSFVSCWTKASAAFYLQDFPEYFGSTPICDITYGASEGRGTVFLNQQTQALAIRSHFFEFVEEDRIDEDQPPALTADQLTLGRSYYILFTTSGGLYRYNINDIVKVVGWHKSVPLLEFLHKGGNICSFTGEKLTESQVTGAVSASLDNKNMICRFFTVIPEFRPEPHYELLIETTNQLNQRELQELQERFDFYLGERNDEYKTKRQSQRLSSPIAFQLQPGSYEELRKKLVEAGVPDAQIKISHLNPKDDIKSYLREKTKQHATST